MKSEFSPFVFIRKSTSGLLLSPGRFFCREAKAAHWGAALGLMSVSALVSTGAALMMKQPASPWLSGCIWFCNAVGMVFITSLFGYLGVRLTQDNHVTLGQLLRLYAFAGSMPTLISWIPGSFWITETWRWWLVGIGLTRGNNLPWRQTAIVIGCTIGLTILFFWSIMMII